MSITPTDVEQEVRSVDIIVSKGDREGNITYANQIFFKLSKYSQGELLDKPHSLLRHPDMPKIIFKLFWEMLESGKGVKAFVKNLAKDGSFYWVFADVKVATNPDGTFRNYTSTRRAMSPAARMVIEPLYDKLIDAERSGGVQESLEQLKLFLSQNGASLETFNEAMEKIQKH